MPLEQELRIFEENKKELLKHHEGKFVLIKGDSIVGTFDNPETAFNVGVGKFGVQPMLIKQILKEDFVEHIPALTHHLIHANP